MRYRRSSTIIPLLLALLTLFCGRPEQKAREQEPAVIFPDGFTVSVDIAETDRDRALGLMFVPSLPDDKGMLFLNEEESRNPFWMKNCLISLDLIWMDADDTIVDISRNLPPCKEDPCPNYYPSASYTKVLEVRGSLASEHNLETGDKLVLIGIREKN